MENHSQTFSDSPVSFNMIAIEGNRNADPFKMSATYRVRLDDFRMGEYPVTQEIWAYVMRDTDMADPSYFKGAKRPVEQVSWEDIDELFLPSLNDKTKDSRPKGTYYRLPTEAEWEYAARGGKYREQYPFEYAGSNKLDEVGWYGYDEENSHKESKQVGLKTPNLLKLYDMSGNVWEWCSDWYDSYPDSNKGITVNPIGPATSSLRVLRGGSWDNRALLCRSTYRDNYSPTTRRTYVGFRLVLSFSPVQKG
jgi:formylglycine-generating enzyme required for sulfatase activity